MCVQGARVPGAFKMYLTIVFEFPRLSFFLNIPSSNHSGHQYFLFCSAHVRFIYVQTSAICFCGNYALGTRTFNEPRDTTLSAIPTRTETSSIKCTRAVEMIFEVRAGETVLLRYQYRISLYSRDTSADPWMGREHLQFSTTDFLILSIVITCHLLSM